ncbi:MAG: serine hydrolase [Spirulina sp. SIO3F2]|nr:serine hydrolase [Spirulina sp. SIO3F2]
MTSHRPLPPRRRRPSGRSSHNKISRQGYVAHSPGTPQPMQRVRKRTSLHTSVAAESMTVLPTRRKKVRKLKKSSRWALMLQKVIAVSSLGIGTGLILSLPLITRPDPQATLSSSSQPVPLASQTTEMSFGGSSELENQLHFPLRQELSDLRTRLGELAGQYGKGPVGVFVLDFDTGDYASWNGTTEFMAASTIKLPLLFFFFQGVDQGKIALDEPLIMEPDLIVGEAGNMQFQAPGTTFSALETVTQMITISDNTATNMIVQRLGGQERVNQRLQQQGLTQTRLNNVLPDIEGTNITSPVDLANVLIDIEQEEGLSQRSRDRVLRILDNVVNDKLLPSGLGKGAAIAHKTGTIGKLLADAGMVDMPNGKRYLTVVMVERPYNDPAAKTLIQQISREVYDYFSTEATP